MKLKRENIELKEMLSKENLIIEDSDKLPSLEDVKELFSDGTTFKRVYEDYKIYVDADVYGYNLRGLDAELVSLEEFIELCNTNNIKEIELLIVADTLDYNYLSENSDKEFREAFCELIESLGDDINNFGSYSFIIEVDNKIRVARITRRLAHLIGLAMGLDITRTKEMLEATDIWGEERETFIDGMWDLADVLLGAYIDRKNGVTELDY